ncbi:MAG: TIGR02996 domain-containing protein [Gemmataceae bacterium]|nr:TIGR02996 domain-containing protein [Gemmataceae bacterium]
MSAPRPELLYLLAACREQFADDAPRHVLADWLEENGDEADRDRAELIRLQLADESAGGHPHHRQRVHALLAARRADWLGPMASGPAPWLERGLWVQPWNGDAPPDAVAGSEAFAWLGVVQWEGEAARLMDSPLADVPGLAFSRSWPRALEQLPRWGCPRSLRLDLLHCGEEAFGRLASLDLPLDDLRLEGGRLGAVRQAQLAASPLVAKLSSLRLNHVELQGDLADLAAAPFLRGLALLDLGSSTVPRPADLLVSERLETLLLDHVALRGAGKLFDRLPHPGRLRRLSLGSATCDDKGLAVLSQAPLSGLRMLDLTFTALEAADVARLAGAAFAPTLEVLRLRDVPLGPEGAKAVASFPAGAMRVLDLEGCALGPAGAQALAAWPGLAGLEALSLEDDAIGPTGAQALAGCDLRRLRRLDLAGNGLGDEGVAALLGGNLLSLEWLALHGNGLGDEGAVALARAPGLERLRTLTVAGKGGKITARGRAALVRRFGAAVS